MEKQSIRKTDFPIQGTWSADHLKEFSERAHVLEKVSSEFKIIVSDLRDFLEQTKYDLDAEELRISPEERRWGLSRHVELVDIVKRIVAKYMDQAFSKLNKIVACFTLAEHTLHRNYFQRNLHPLLLHSPFVSRAYFKPLGYPGDYQMMNMIYGDHNQGDSLFAQLINRYSCSAPAARAVEGRVPFLLQKFNHTIKRVLKERETATFLSIGSGPAREIQELIATDTDSDRCHVNLIDMLPEALFYCQEKILDLKMATGSRVKVDYFNRSARDFIRFSHSLDTLKGQDLIYAIGLFDYLPFHIAKRVIQNLYPLLAEGGELIVGNFDISNPTRFYMEYALDWYLLHRDREEMLRLAEELPFSASSSIITGEEGVQLYLIIEKGEKSGGPLCRKKSGKFFTWENQRTLP